MTEKKSMLAGIPKTGWIVILILGICGLCTLFLIVGSLIAPFITYTTQNDDINSSTSQDAVETEESLTPDEAVYINLIEVDATSLAAELEELGTFLNANPNYLNWTAEQRMQVDSTAADIQLHYAKMQNITPPIGYEEVHQKYTNVTYDLNEAMRLFKEGISENDEEKINQATDLIEGVQPQIQETITLLEAKIAE